MKSLKSKAAIKKIDRALKYLYQLGFSQTADRFVIHDPKGFKIPQEKVENSNLRGALLLRELVSPKGNGITVGIYLSQAVLRELENFDQWERGGWTVDQMGAFSVAAEEISHFQYVIYNMLRGRSISQLELELQGEVDRFLLAYFANGMSQGEDLYYSLYESLFSSFHLHDDLSEEQRNRYLLANQMAKQFIYRMSKKILDLPKSKSGLQLLRGFYRLPLADKVSLAFKLSG